MPTANRRDHRARRENAEISTGSVTRITIGASIMPVTTTTASGFCTCEPIPPSAAGNSPIATTQVISTGRSLQFAGTDHRAHALIAFVDELVVCERMMMPSITAMPNSAMKPIAADTLM